MNSDASLTVADGRVVTIHYSLKLDDGTPVDTSLGGEPMPYLHGASNIVPGLERELSGRKAGDRLSVVVTPEDGYGVRHPDGVHDVPVDELPDDIEPGAMLHAETPDGEVVVYHVVDVSEDYATLDMNHPLAGENLHFAIEIVEVRLASRDEIEHGHAHGPDGEHHH